MARKQDDGQSAKMVLSAVTLIVLAHLPLWLLRPYSALPQAPFEVDVLIAVGIFTLNRWIGAVAVLLAWSLSLLRAVAVNYHFHNIAEFLDTSRFADLLSYSTFISPTNFLAAAVMLLVVGAVFRCMAFTRSSPLPILGSIALLALLDVLNGSGIARGRDAPFVPINVLGSPSYNLLVAERKFVLESKQPLLVIQPVPRSYQALLNAMEEPRGGAMLVLVESLGVPQESEIRAWLLGKLRSPALLAVWDLNDGDEAFFGGTVAAELRVLCGLQGHYSRLTLEQSQGCLPRLFQARGDVATAMHGFSPRMFDRSTWWPIVGFTQTRFAAAWAGQKSAHCNGAFNGICDHNLIASAIELAGERRQFVYALTINTHLPIPPVAVNPDLQSLCDQHGVPDAACELVQAHGNLLADLAEQLAGAPDLLRQVVVVGDHSPPFNDFRARRVFKTSQVPSLILQRRLGP